MKKRIIVALIWLPLLFLGAFVLPEIVAVILVGLLSAVAVYELLYCTKLVKHFRMVVYSMAAAIGISFWSYYGCPYVYGLAGVFLFYAALFAELLASKGKIPVSRAALCFMGGLIIPYMLSSLSRIMAMPLNRHLILLPFAVAFLMDIGAYFVGSFYGKTKLAPTISPKKTVEGLLGGLLVTVLGTMIYTLILQLACGLQVNYFYALVYSVVGGLVAVLGDLSFSVIKRQTGIKDYGTIFSAHGGVLDRFDSVIAVAPLIEFFLLTVPIAH